MQKKLQQKRHELPVVDRLVVGHPEAASASCRRSQPYRRMNAPHQPPPGLVENPPSSRSSWQPTPPLEMKKENEIVQWHTTSRLPTLRGIACSEEPAWAAAWHCTAASAFIGKRCRRRSLKSPPGTPPPPPPDLPALGNDAKAAPGSSAKWKKKVGATCSDAAAGPAGGYFLPKQGTANASVAEEKCLMRRAFDRQTEELKQHRLDQIRF